MMHFHQRLLTRVFPIVATIDPVVRSSSVFASATDSSSVISIVSSPKPENPLEA